MVELSCMKMYTKYKYHLRLSVPKGTRIGFIVT
nr:MAG TPA: hypothetical protein [Caudoviricetes sp.]DAJ88483.1 MAG TPA: hypothetical protein [Bacteriophage sp.]DAV23375.1 MAG TPA: hypothetical protein [Bacteriophage sp.]